MKNNSIRFLPLIYALNTAKRIPMRNNLKSKMIIANLLLIAVQLKLDEKKSMIEIRST